MMDWLELPKGSKNHPDLNIRPIRTRPRYKAERFDVKIQLRYMHKAIKGNDISSVKNLLSTIANTDLKELDQNGSFLKSAASFHHLEVLEVLLRHACAVVCSKDTGYSVLHQTIKYGYIDMLKVMLSNGIEVDQPSLYEHKTALHLATQQNCIKMARLLLRHGADPNKCDIYGCSALHIAAGLDFSEMTSLMIENEASIDAIDHVTWTPLLHCASMNHTRSAIVLLKHKAVITSQTRYGKTALHLACQKGHLAMVELLLGWDLSPDINDIHGKRPSDYTDNTLITSLLKNASKPTDDTGIKTIKHIPMKIRSMSLADLIEPEFIKDDYYDKLDLQGNVRPRSLSDGEVVVKSSGSKKYTSDLSRSFSKVFGKRKQSRLTGKEGEDEGVRSCNSIDSLSSIQEEVCESLVKMRKLEQKGQNLQSIGNCNVYSYSCNDVSKEGVRNTKMTKDVRLKAYLKGLQQKPCSTPKSGAVKVKTNPNVSSTSIGYSTIISTDSNNNKCLVNQSKDNISATFELSNEEAKRSSTMYEKITSFFKSTTSLNTDNSLKDNNNNLDNNDTSHSNQATPNETNCNNLKSEEVTSSQGSSQLSQCISDITDTCITSIQDVSRAIDDIQNTRESDLRFFKITELKTYLNQWALKTENFKNYVHVDV